jgi:hypothetical protein
VTKKVAAPLVAEPAAPEKPKAKRKVVRKPKAAVVVVAPETPPAAAPEPVETQS